MPPSPPSNKPALTDREMLDWLEAFVRVNRALAIHDGTCRNVRYKVGSSEQDHASMGLGLRGRTLRQAISQAYQVDDIAAAAGIVLDCGPDKQGKA